MRAYRTIAVVLAIAALTSAAARAQQVGTATAVNPLSESTPPGAATAPLVVGARIIHKERIHTTASGTVQLAFLDKSTLSIAPNTNIEINDFVYDPNSGRGHMLTSLTEGALRFVGGALSHQGEASIVTPAAAVGIRGGTLTMVYGKNGLVVFNHFGVITVHNGAGTLTIDRSDFKVTILNWNTLGLIERVSNDDIDHLPRFTSRPGENGGVAGLHNVTIAVCGVLGARSNNCPNTPWLPTDTGQNDANHIITQGTQQGSTVTTRYAR